MMQNLNLEEGAVVTIKNVSLPKATFVKLRPQSVDFLEIYDPKAVLEVTLRQFTCLTTGDQICIKHADRDYWLEICEVKPTRAACIIETDCNVDFEEPVGYKDSKYGKQEEAAKKALLENEAAKNAPIKRELQKARVVTEEERAAREQQFHAFSGAAKRIDGKKLQSSSSSEAKSDDTSGASKEMKGEGPTVSSSSSSSSFAGSVGRTLSVAESAAAAAERRKESQAAAATSASGTPSVAPARKSRVGDKFSKKKKAVEAFTGPGHKLS
jgi:ubiquitin fusion degradation protein 1